MNLNHRIGHSIELIHPALELLLWRYVYGSKPKPYFHPICTPSGHCLTLFEPHDHVWHRGLWYAIKFINGENFWEEHEPFGIQRTALPPSVVHTPDERIVIRSEIDWVRGDGESVVFREQRTISHVPLDDEAYALDFQTALRAQADLVLDRTPYTTWGGYGGLILRGTRNWQETRLLFPDGSTSDRPTGIPATWCDLSGKLDGGLEQTGGLAIFDHPNNPRHPTPWYGVTGPSHYFNAAFLFHEPMSIPGGEILTFRYRVLLHNQIWDVPRLQAAYEAYTAERILEDFSLDTDAV